MSLLLVVLALAVDCPWLTTNEAGSLLGAPPIEAFAQPARRDATTGVELELCSYRTSDRSVTLVLFTHESPVLARAAAERREAEAVRQEEADRREALAAGGDRDGTPATARVSAVEQIRGVRARFTGSPEAGSADYRAQKGRRTLWLQVAWRGTPETMVPLRVQMRRAMAVLLLRV